MSGALWEDAGRFVRQQRTGLALDQAELGRRLGVGQQTVSGWERGLSRPRAAQITELAELFAADPVQLMVLFGYLTADTTRRAGWYTVVRVWRLPAAGPESAAYNGRDPARAAALFVHAAGPPAAPEAGGPAAAMSTVPGEGDTAALYLQDGTGDDAVFLGFVTPRLIAEEITRRWNAAAGQ